VYSSHRPVLRIGQQHRSAVGYRHGQQQAGLVGYQGIVAFKLPWFSDLQYLATVHLIGAGYLHGTGSNIAKKALPVDGDRLRIIIGEQAQVQAFIRWPAYAPVPRTLSGDQPVESLPPCSR